MELENIDNALHVLTCRVFVRCQTTGRVAQYDQCYVAHEVIDIIAACRFIENEYVVVILDAGTNHKVERVQPLTYEIRWF